MPSKCRYMLNYTGLDGARRHKAFYGKTKRIAKRKAEQFLQTVKTQALDAPTFKEWSAEYLHLYIEPRDDITQGTKSTNAKAVSKLNEYFGDALLTEIMPADVIHFVQTAETDTTPRKPLSAAYVQKLLSIMRQIFNAAIDNGICYRNPARSVRPPKRSARVKRAYTIEQARIFSRYASKHPDGLLPFIAIHTGLRPSESMGLKPCDFDGDILTVSRTITYDGKHVYDPIINEHSGKTKSALRHIICDPLLIKKIGSLSIPIKEKDFIFGGVTARAYDWTYRRFLRDFCADNPQVPPLTLYELRHTWFTLMQTYNADRRVVDLQGGHSLGNLTDDVYAHYDVDFLRKNTVLIPW